MMNKIKTNKKYYEKNKNEISIQKKDYYNKNRIEILKKRKEYYNTHKEEKQEYDKKYRKKNKEKIKKRDREYTIKNSEKIRKYNLRYYECHKLESLLNGARKRAYCKNLKFSLTIENVLEKLEKTKDANGKFICAITKKEMFFNSKIRMRNISIDRIDNNKGYTYNNIEFISNEANSLKGNNTIESLVKIKEYITFGLNGNLPLQSDDYTDKSVISRKYNIIKSNSKRKNIEFNLEKSDIKLPNVDFFGYPTSICKGCPHQERLSCDRIDPIKGYIKGNIYWISMRANMMKGKLTIELCDKLIAYIKNNLRKGD